MLIVDRALAERAESGRPIGVGIVGAGFFASALVRQIVHHVPGMRVVALASRTLESAARAALASGLADVRAATGVSEIERAAAAKALAYCADPALLAQVPAIEAVIEATGSLEFGAQAAVAAIAGGKHLILVNAELDATVGPALKARGDAAGVVVTGADGDQPAAQMNLYRHVQAMGLTPLLCGNIKGFQDHARTPETQAGWAREWGFSLRTATANADGSKISCEQAVVANATGFTVARFGMSGFRHPGPIDSIVARYDRAALTALGGVVDYALEALPGPGVFVLAANPDPARTRDLKLYKLGEGPLYCFSVPFHLGYMEVPIGVARAVLLGDATIAAAGPPRVEVVAVAKFDLRAGARLDGMGGFTAYGQCATVDEARAQRWLPIGVAEDCILQRDVARGSVIHYEDVAVPPGRLIDRLRAEQAALQSA
jgi:predicted homoserine dehydrogenase-like protein